MKTLRTLRRHRKQRCAKLRELTREDEDGVWWGSRRRGYDGSGEGMECPVCVQFVRGDLDVVEAHVDACLANLKLTDEREEGRESMDVDMDVDVDVDGDGMLNVMDGVSFEGILQQHGILTTNTDKIWKERASTGVTGTTRMSTTI